MTESQEPQTKNKKKRRRRRLRKLVVLASAAGALVGYRQRKLNTTRD